MPSFPKSIARKSKLDQPIVKLCECSGDFVINIIIGEHTYGVQSPGIFDVYFKTYISKQL
jgi:hypothetical protein